MHQSPSSQPRFRQGVHDALDLVGLRVVISIENESDRASTIFALRGENTQVLSLTSRYALVRHLRHMASWSEWEPLPDVVVFDDEPPYVLASKVMDALENCVVEIPAIVIVPTEEDASALPVQKLTATATIAHPLTVPKLRAALAALLQPHAPEGVR